MVANGQIFTPRVIPVTWLPREKQPLMDSPFAFLVRRQQGRGRRRKWVDLYLDQFLEPIGFPREPATCGSVSLHPPVVAICVAAAFIPIGNVGGQPLYISANAGATWTTHETNHNTGGRWLSSAETAQNSLPECVPASSTSQPIRERTGRRAHPRTVGIPWACSADGNKRIAAAENGKIYVCAPTGVAAAAADGIQHRDKYGPHYLAFALDWLESSTKHGSHDHQLGNAAGGRQ